MFFLILLLLAGVLVTTSCEDTPPDVNEEEVITTLTLTFEPTNGGDAVTFQYQDLDGDGGEAPTITEGTVDPNTTYTVRVGLLNESVTPAEDVALEVAEEDADHQFFFVFEGIAATHSYTDTDGNGNPLGLLNEVVTTDAGSGTMTVTLRHEPNKAGDGVAAGDPTNAGGETDIEVTFDFVVQQ